jgi:DNA-binding transcriptional LysR family regulator
MSIRNLNWELCRSLLAVLREGSLSGAARSLGVTHPTMRRHLDELEAAVGANLFVRSPTGLVPTERALELRAPAEAMEATFEHLVRTATADAGVIAGTVRITASEVIGAEVLPEILAALKSNHPGLTFELNLSDAIKDVLRRDADIAVRMVRPVQPDILARKVAVIELGLFAHRRWLQAHAYPSSLQEMVAGGAMIGEDKGTAILRGLAAAGIDANRADFAFRSDSNIAQFAALRAGLGIGVCQVPLAARDPMLERVLVAFSQGLEVWLATHPHQRSVARLNVTLDALAAGLADYAKG